MPPLTPPSPDMGGRAPPIYKNDCFSQNIRRRDLNFCGMIHCTRKIKRVKDVIPPPPVMRGKAPLFTKTIVSHKVLGVET